MLTFFDFWNIHISGDKMQELCFGTVSQEVILLQKVLQRQNYYLGKIDGKFLNLTYEALKRFQKEHYLVADGLVKESTWKVLEPYIEEIKDDNKKVIQTDQEYSIKQLKKDVQKLKYRYPFLQIEAIGFSVLQNPIYGIQLGWGKKEVFYTASIHANEWITSLMLMKWLEEMCESYVEKKLLGGYDVHAILKETTIYLVPMCNPDGVDVVTGNIAKNSKVYEKIQKIAKDYPEVPFPTGWKANIEGIDLNLQFPAGWKQAKKIKFEQGIISPAPRDFVGNSSLCAVEAQALYHFTRLHDFKLILAYHTQGKEIYWQFQNYAPKEAFKIGKCFEKVSGYTLTDVPYASSFAGYKDWFLQEYQRPGYTIEAGIGKNPLPLSQFDEIYNDNLGILLLGMSL